ncbi:MAG: diguanylate cyclase [Chloroflexi bacterium]|nr:diguanylate cyclase [Chloroflexota bacterium]
MNISYAVALLIAAATSATIGIISWKRRSATGASGLMFFMLAEVIWATTYAVRWMMTEPSAQLFWLRATFFGAATHTTLVAIFVLQFTGRSHLLTRRNLRLLAIVPLVTLFLLWTDDWHGLFFGGQHSTDLIYSGGPWFWFFILYTYIQVFILIGLFVQAYLRASGLFRRQVGTMLFATFTPLAGNILGLLGSSPFPNLDLTPFLYTISGMIYAYALFGLRLLDVVPIARHKLVDEMTDGVIVLDASKRIVDINPAAERLIGISSSAIGQLSADILKETLHLDQAGDLITASLTELRISENPPRDIDLQILPLFDDRQSISGHLLILRDITARKKAEEALQASEKKFRELILYSSDPIFAFSPDETYRFVNEAFARTFGKEPVEIMGKTPHAIFPFEEAEKRLTLVRQVFKTGKKGEIEVKVTADTGEERYYLTLADPIKDEQGKVLYVTCISKNITERKQAEDELLRAQGELEAAHHELQQSFERQQQLAQIDDLTLINNHRSIMQLAEREFDVAMRYQPPLSMIFFDIDNFKHINDTFGHPMGDQALIKTIQTVCVKLRSADLIGRYGGDEFLILLPHTTAQDALPLAERIHASVAAMRLNTDRGALTLTISIGIAQSIHEASQTDSVQSLLHRADLALYAAKNAGKNCTMIFDTVPTGTS